MHPQAPLSPETASQRATSDSKPPLFILPNTTSQRDLLLAAIRSSSSTAVYAADLSVVATRISEFYFHLPGVIPYYAVKCNPDPVLVRFLANMGLSFDCASVRELSLIQSVLPDHALSSRTIFANPIKSKATLRIARECLVDLMTFDCVEELQKIACIYPDANLLLRIAVADSDALCPLSSKFGTQASELQSIFKQIIALNLRLVGVAFHVGSGAKHASAYANALQDAKRTFEKAERAGLPRLKILDIGGGFPGYDGEVGVTFSQIADTVREGVKQLFNNQVQLIAEPGRYFSTSAYELAAQVIGERKMPARPCVYFLSEGVFGSFRDAWLLDIKYEVELLIGEGGDEEICDLLGPSGEDIDVVRKGILLPPLKVGDWLRFRNLGAYSRSLWSFRGGTQEFETIYGFRTQ